MYSSRRAEPFSGSAYFVLSPVTCCHHLIRSTPHIHPAFQTLRLSPNHGYNNPLLNTDVSSSPANQTGFLLIHALPDCNGCNRYAGSCPVDPGLYDPRNGSAITGHDTNSFSVDNNRQTTASLFLLYLPEYCYQSQ